MAVSWRLSDEIKHQSSDRAEKVEKLTAKITGVILLMPAVYIVVDAGRRLPGFGEDADKSFIVIALTALYQHKQPRIIYVWGGLRRTII